MDVQFGADAALLPHAAPGGVRFTFDAAPGTLHARAARVGPAWLRDGVIHQLSVPAFGGDFDDADITPCDFLDEIRAALEPGVALISQSCDEFHHLHACDLTDEGGIRAMLRRCAHGEADGAAFARYWTESTYSFPMGQEFDEPAWTGWMIGLGPPEKKGRREGALK